MSDITDELERYAAMAMPGYPNDVCSRAKAEIEWLRAALHETSGHRGGESKKTRPDWKPTPMARLIDAIRWYALNDRRTRWAFAAASAILAFVVILLLAGCQMPLRTLP